jgi:D-glycero-D-manno-heptose 1,7-bisphosphate phosphatase
MPQNNIFTMQYKLKPALCLDLDGTVRVTKSGKDFPEHTLDWKLNDGMEAIIRKYKYDGFVIIGISNQAGVAHGFKSLNEVDAENMHLHNLFGGTHPFNLILFAPCHDKGKIEPFNVRSFLRKPEIGMLAAAEHRMFRCGTIIDWDKSIMVGDREEDKECAANAGIKFYHINEFLKINHGESEQV